MRFLLFAPALLILVIVGCSGPSNDDEQWEIVQDANSAVDSTGAETASPGDSLGLDNSIETDHIGQPGTWPSDVAEGEGRQLLDLLRHVWGGVAATPVDGDAPATASGVDWNQREGILQWSPPQTTYGNMWAPLWQAEGSESCALEVDGDKLTVVAPESANGSPGAALERTFQAAGLEAAVQDYLDSGPTELSATAFAQRCEAAGHTSLPLTLTEVLTLADEGAQVALVAGSLDNLDAGLDVAAAILVGRSAVLCCEQGFYVTGYRGALAAIADLSAFPPTEVECAWTEPALPALCASTCETADDCREAKCADGKDNDGDGASDCDDPDCNGAVCGPQGETCGPDGECVCPPGETCECVPQGAEVCDNGMDDDCDGKLDCADADCEGEECDWDGYTCLGGVCKCPEAVEDCMDDVDNDCDGAIDCDDDGCDGLLCGTAGETCFWTPFGSSCDCPNAGPETACGNGEDDDCDGDVDCEDVDCLGKSCGKNNEICHENDAQEVVCGCEAGAVEKVCDDGKDNDCDGTTDCLDTDCVGEPCGANGKLCMLDFDTLEPSCTCPGGDSENVCNNGLDDDCDGTQDCADPDCDEESCGTFGMVCSALEGKCVCPGAGPLPGEDCSDGIDNNCNGNTDCDELFCLGKECGPNGKTCDLVKGCACTGGEQAESSCGDGKDSDCDGKIDCFDSDCDTAVCGEGKWCQLDACVCHQTEWPEQSCSDGIDNDCDGAIDCLDDSCPAVSCCLNGGLSCEALPCAADCEAAGGLVGEDSACWVQSTCPCEDDEYEPNEDYDLATAFPLDGDSGTISAIYCPGANFDNRDFYDALLSIGDSFEATVTVTGGSKPPGNPLQWAPPTYPAGINLNSEELGDGIWKVTRSPLNTTYFYGATADFVALVISGPTRFSYDLEWKIDKCLGDELEENNFKGAAKTVEKGKSYNLTICQDDIDYLGIGSLQEKQKLTVTIEYAAGDYGPFFGWNIYLWKGDGDSAVGGTYGSPKNDPGGTVTWSYTTSPDQVISGAVVSVSGDFFGNDNPAYVFSYQIEDAP